MGTKHEEVADPHIPVSSKLEILLIDSMIGLGGRTRAVCLQKERAAAMRTRAR